MPKLTQILVGALRLSEHNRSSGRCYCGDIVCFTQETSYSVEEVSTAPNCFIATLWTAIVFIERSLS